MRVVGGIVSVDVESLVGGRVSDGVGRVVVGIVVSSGGSPVDEGSGPDEDLLELPPIAEALDAAVGC